MTVRAVIVAAGKGVRAGGPSPKQYQPLAGVPVLARAINAFAGHGEIGGVVVVLNPADRALFDAVVLPHLRAPGIRCVSGGATRAGSVRAGLAALDEEAPDLVLIHDGARPMIGAALISRVIAASREHGAAAPAIAVSDTLWRGQDGEITAHADRRGLFAAQTPQGFRFADIRAAHEQAAGTETDDAEVARRAGMTVAIVDGAAENLKITQPGDFGRVENMLGGSLDIRNGNGFDVHAFGDGDHVILCGIRVPHHRSLKGHSDADVPMHALTDAIYGALALGDIGHWFPPGDAQWKDAPSRIFLEHAVAQAQAQDFAVTHADCTIICEAPKIGPHCQPMRENLADILGIAVQRVSVKATTSERLGFTGRGEGIAALATATLVKS